MLGIPLIFLWLALAIDKEENENCFPKPVVFFSVANAALLLAVFTNDLHRLVFVFDIDGNWLHEYEYGIVYYFVFGFIVAEFFLTQGLLLRKAKDILNGGKLLLLLSCYALPVLYAAGYALQWTFAKESDFTTVLCMFILIILETMLQTRLVSTNMMYYKLFTHAPIKMSIMGNDEITQCH